MIVFNCLLLHHIGQSSFIRSIPRLVILVLPVRASAYLSIDFQTGLSNLIIQLYNRVNTFSRPATPFTLFWIPA